MHLEKVYLQGVYQIFFEQWFFPCSPPIYVSAKYAKDIKVAVYGRLFTLANMNDMAEGTTYDDYLNRESVKHYVNCKAEEAIESGVRYQFVRTGYFIEDTKNPGTFIQIVELKDSFSK